MSWASLLKKTSSISTSPNLLLEKKEPIPNFQSELVRSRSQIHSASLKNLLEFRHSGIKKNGIMYPPTLCKASISLSKFCQLHQDHLQWLYNQIILPSTKSITSKVPSFAEFAALAWIFTDC